jgi:hypothetical protein
MTDRSKPADLSGKMRARPPDVPGLRTASQPSPTARKPQETVAETLSNLLQGPPGLKPDEPFQGARDGRPIATSAGF